MSAKEKNELAGDVGLFILETGLGILLWETGNTDLDGISPPDLSD